MVVNYEINCWRERYSLVVTDTKEVAKYGQGVAAFNQVANKVVCLHFEIIDWVLLLASRFL